MTIRTGNAESFAVPGLAGATRPDARPGNQQNKALHCDFPCWVARSFKGKQGLILFDQIRAVDKTRLVKKLGVIDEATQMDLCQRLQELFVY